MYAHRGQGVRRTIRPLVVCMRGRLTCFYLRRSPKRSKSIPAYRQRTRRRDAKANQRPRPSWRCPRRTPCLTPVPGTGGHRIGTPRRSTPGLINGGPKGKPARALPSHALRLRDRQSGRPAGDADAGRDRTLGPRFRLDLRESGRRAIGIPGVGSSDQRIIGSLIR
jgi:hypothetical protein